MKSPEKLYEFHVANLREIDHAMERIARSLRGAISQGDEPTVSSFMCLYALLLGVWAECRLRKLIYEPNGFNDAERKRVRSQGTHVEQWEMAVEIGFRRQYRKPRAALTSGTLGHSAFSRYTGLSKMLMHDLVSVIELRNKLAHGQWKYPLNDEGDDIAQDQMDALRSENIMSLQFKKRLLTSLAAAIHDLVLSRPTFERDFDNHYRAIDETRRNLMNRSYEVYDAKMKKKYERGKMRKLSNKPQFLNNFESPGYTT